VLYLWRGAEKLHGCNYYPLWSFRVSVPICSIDNEGSTKPQLGVGRNPESGLYTNLFAGTGV